MLDTAVARYDDVTEQRERRIAQAKATITRNERLMPNWIDLVEEAARQVEKHLGVEGSWIKIMGPFGIGATVSAYIHDADNNIIWAADFRVYFKESPSMGGLRQGRPRTELKVVNTANKVREYPSGSIGELNGLGYEELTVNDWPLSKLVTFGREQEPHPAPWDRPKHNKHIERRA